MSNIDFTYGQNIDYESRITSFYGNCNESGTEEYTWKGWISDNVNTVETYSGCIQRNNNGAVTQFGTYATRNRFNTTATQIIGRLDSWEDDRGSRCDFDIDSNPFNNDDDCRTERTTNFNLTNPLEYQYTNSNQSVGTGTFNMNLFYSYRYSSTSLPAATEYTGTSFLTGGNRPFWGAMGNWASVGLDCAASGTITHNQTSSFSTTVSCKRQVQFRWRVSSEVNFDFLEVYVNGVRRNRISGNVSWTTITLNLDYGTNIVEWRYDKDGSNSTGLDRGFVDDIQFIDATTIDPGSISTTDNSYNVVANPVILSTAATAQAYSTTINYQWQYSTNGVTGWTNIGGATGLSYDPPAGLTTTRYYRRRVQDVCGNTDYSNIIQVEILPQFVYDTGSWDPYDPGLSAPIASNSTHSVIIRENTTQTNSFTTGTLTIDAGITLTTSGDVGIEVTGPVNLNGVLDLGESGQLVQSNSSVLNVGASGMLRKTREGNPNLFRYTYWGSPVSNFGTSNNSGFDISTVMKDGTTGIPRNLIFTNTTTPDGIPGDAINPATISSKWLYTFRNLNGNYANWEFITPSALLLTGQGYTMKGTGIAATGQPFIFQGVPNNGVINLGVSSGSSYLLGNPYPSAIDSHQFLLDNPHLDGTIYYWEHYGGDSHQLSGYQGGYAMYNFSGGVGAPSLATPAIGVSTGGTATKLPGRYIPVAQGFFVEAASLGTISFNNDQRLYAAESAGVSVFIKSNPNSLSTIAQPDVRSKFRLGMTSPDNGHRQLLLTIDPNASFGIDQYYDGELFELLPDDFGFNINNNRYGIQGVPSLSNGDVIPLIVEITNSGNYKFGIDELSNWNNNLPIYLYDQLTGIQYDLLNSPASINLVLGLYTDRFEIRFQNSVLSTNEFDDLDGQVMVYQPDNSNKLFIELSSDNLTLEEVGLIDISGRSIINLNSEALQQSNSIWSFNTESIATSTYILQLKINGSYITRKVVINTYSKN